MKYTPDEIREAGLDRFDKFLCELWAHLALPAPTPVQIDIARWLQYGPDRQILQAYRGVGKSWMTAGYVCWNLFLNPELKIEVVSAGEGLASDFTKFVKQIIYGWDLLHHLKPGKDQLSSSEKFDVGPARSSKDPSIKSVGITGQLTGSRADIIIADDIEVPKNTISHNLREKLSRSVEEFAAVLKPLPTSKIIYLGTPQVEDTLYNKLLLKGYTTRIWPAAVPKDPSKYQGNLAPYVTRLMDAGVKAGEPVDPQRFDADVLANKRIEYAASGYQLQFMLDTSISDAEKHPLKLTDLIVTDVDADRGNAKLVWGRDKQLAIQDLFCRGLPGDVYYGPAWRHTDMAPYTKTVMAIDPSGRGKDETGYAVGSFLFSQVFLKEVGGFRDGFGENTLVALARAAIKHRVHTLIIEENYGGGMFANLLIPVLHQEVARMRQEHEDQKWFAPQVNPEDWDGWSKGQKELRICDVMEPLVQSHRLIVDRQVIQDDLKVEEHAYSFVYQFSRMSRDRGALPHEDRLEAVSMVCEYFTSMLDRDRDKMIAVQSDSLFQKEVREAMRDARQFGCFQKPLRRQWGTTR